jgi:protein phosphatase
LPLSVQVAGDTDKGLVRSGNEDNYLIDRKHHVYAVCDGMGGHQAGEVASMLAVDIIQSSFEYFTRELLEDDILTVGRSLPEKADLLLKSIRLANRAIANESVADTSKAGMGTTVVACALEADTLAVAHVGDSRAYRLTERDLQPLTRDHSWVTEIQDAQNLTREEADNLVGKNIITRALGVRENVEIDMSITKVRKGDIYILCSDGLCGFADDEEIFHVANRARDDLKEIVAQLIQMANDRGGQDNVTVIAFEIEDVNESPLPEMEPFTLASESPDVLTHENDLLEEIRKKKAESDSTPSLDDISTPKKSRVLWMSTVTVVIILAILIIYFMGRP